ncbi:MAG TPA: LptA/OstA family protein [Longimicrobium sp.]|nr:LptA/OstA family protein [Longimicrobium sp.]
MPIRLAPLFFALAALPGFHREAAAQNVCDLVYQTGEWVSVGAEGQRVINASGPLLVRCSNGEELRADSAVLYEAINEVHLFRRVDYQDPTRSLTSDYATYNGNNGRLWATGNVVFTDKNRGSTLRGPNLEYYRAGEGRPDAQAIATERPHLTVAPRSGRQREPMEIDADRITTVGEKFVTAEGNVVIDGKEMDAWAQEAYYDADEERMELRRNARARGENYELTGDYIQSNLTEGALDEVLSRGNARLVESRLRVTGPQLRLFFARDSLQRLVSGQEAGSAGDSTAVKLRSVALARGFRMEADSLEALTPGQRIQRVIAIGTAEGQSWDTARVAGPDPADAAGPDTAPAMELGEQDLIFADTIIGFFKADSVQPVPTGGQRAADSARAAMAVPADLVQPDSVRPAQRDSSQAELERMLATGNARSLYRMRPSREERADTTLKRGINYVIADTIDLSFFEGEVDIATVRGLKRGVYLDPINADSARADSLRVDTAGVDTAGVAPADSVAPPAVAPAEGTPPEGQNPPQTPPSTPPATPTPAAPPERRPATTGGRP